MKLIIGGCTKIPGYKSVDINGRADVIHDLRLKWPFMNNSVDVIFSSHFLEHLTKEEARFCVQECNRVLKIGGILRISVPDLYIITKKYIDNDTVFYEEICNGKERYPGRTFADKYLYVVYGQGHKYLYDYESLSYLLRDYGFEYIERKEYMESEIPNVKELDNRPLQSLFIEAKKGYELESVKKENTVPLFRSVLFRLHVNAVKFRKIIDNHAPIIINILRFMKKILFKSTDKQKVIT